MEELPFRIIYTGPPGRVKRRVAMREGQQKKVERFDGLLEIASYGTAGDVVTAPFDGTLLWLAPLGWIRRGTVVARMGNVSVELGASRVTVWDGEPMDQRPTRYLPLPYALTTETVPRPYRISVEEAGYVTERAGKLGVKVQDLMRALIHEFATLPAGEQMALIQRYQDAMRAADLG